jgi:hypothetical protein
MRHWDMVLIGEDLATGSSGTGSPGDGTFATLESALNWLLESPGTRDLRVTALSQEQPMRHVVGHFTLDANFDRFARESAQPDDRIVHEPENPE